MDREEVIRMAREAGVLQATDTEAAGMMIAGLRYYAELVAAKEREACADIVENANTPDCGGWTAQGIAEAIRARGATDGKPT